jgi:hypothetical protein
MINYSLVLSIFYSGKAWVLNGDTYEGLDWFDSDLKPTKEELDSQWEEVQSITKKQNCKTKAKQLLINTDWSAFLDIQNELDNYNEFAIYRNQVRNLYLNPIENPVFPIEPIAIWRQLYE